VVLKHIALCDVERDKETLLAGLYQVQAIVLCTDDKKKAQPFCFIVQHDHEHPNMSHHPARAGLRSIVTYKRYVPRISIGVTWLRQVKCTH
jgi:hypothetical protein